MDTSNNAEVQYNVDVVLQLGITVVLNIFYVFVFCLNEVLHETFYKNRHIQFIRNCGRCYLNICHQLFFHTIDFKSFAVENVDVEYSKFSPLVFLPSFAADHQQKESQKRTNEVVLLPLFAVRFRENGHYNLKGGP